MSISEVKAFIQENDWRIVVTAIGLVAVALISPSDETNTVIEICGDRVAAGSISDTAQVRAADVVSCYEEMKHQEYQSILPLSPLEPADTQ